VLVNLRFYNEKEGLVAGRPTADHVGTAALGCLAERERGGSPAGQAVFQFRERYGGLASLQSSNALLIVSALF
jgi:hypothetical protein